MPNVGNLLPECCSVTGRARVLVIEPLRPDSHDWISVVVNWPALVQAKGGAVRRGRIDPDIRSITLIQNWATTSRED